METIINGSIASSGNSTSWQRTIASPQSALSLICLFSSITIAQAQYCPNIGFEDGSFNNWLAYTGDYTVPNDAFGISPGQHTIFTAPAIDPFSCGGLNVLPPNGANSARLGNSNVGAQAEQLVYIIDVTTQNPIFNYQYASVMEDPGHDPSEQPKLSIRVLDNLGNVVGGACGVFEVYAGQAGQTFQNCGGVTWLPWSSAAIDLTAYIGQQIRIEFTTFDCSLGGHFGYSYISAECMPQVTDISFCQGANATITGPTGFQQYAWSTGETTQTITIPSPTNNQTITCDLSSVGNQGACGVQVEYQLEISAPVANFTATPNCLNVISEFTDLSTFVTDTIVAWNWDFGDLSTSTNQNPTNLYGADGNFNVTLIVETANGCQDTSIQSFTVFPLPVANFTIQNECFYDELAFNNLSTGNNLTYNWQFEDGFSSTAATIGTHQFANPGDYDIQLIVVSSDGCTDSLLSVAVAYDQPVAVLSIDSVCQGLNSSFTDASFIPLVQGDVINSWAWNFGDGGVSNLQNPTHVYASENTYSVQLIATSSNGCKDTASSTAFVWPNPVADFEFIEACEYTPIQFTDQSTVSNANTVNQIVDWTWNFGDATTASTQNVGHLYANDGLFNASLTVETNHGCTHTIALPVRVYPKPISAFNGFNLEGCSPNCATVFSTATIPAPSSIQSTQWSFSNGFASTIDSVSYCLENTTTEPISLDVQLIVSSDFGCLDTSFASEYIVSNPIPVAEFTYNPSQPGVLHNTIQFNNSSFNADLYQWDFGGNGFSNEFEPEILFPFQLEGYTIQLVASTAEGCHDTAVAHLMVEDQILVYVPNTFTPDGDEYNNDFFPVISSEIEPTDYLLSIFNRWGQIIFQSKNIEQGWDGTFDGQFVQDGTYVWKVEFKYKARGYEETGHVNIFR